MATETYRFLARHPSLRNQKATGFYMEPTINESQWRKKQSILLNQSDVKRGALYSVR
ncbi:hypothetical protein COLO4_10089 [Corchorus olitorius]|uniref:Uncharacterized protein n=1 Tax=Corchorus olitorius TaxID=93759 RepID=A0A1R3KA05_9ROSI|nr:hypothetical protein COLO4_10089 [Corchorus olitorius]